MFGEVVQKCCTVDLGCEVVGFVGTVADAVNVILDRKPNVVLLDMRLPDGDGFDVVKQVQYFEREIAFIAISAHTDAFTVYRAARLGFVGWIDKDTQTLSALGATLTAVRNGEVCFSPTFREVQRTMREDPRSFAKTLTPWQWKLLELFGEGLTNEEVASRLGLTVRTTATHRSAIMRNLGIPSTPKLMHYALTRGFTRLAWPSSTAKAARK